MLWSDLVNGTKIKLVQDFYSIGEISSSQRYELWTKEEVDKLVSIAYKKGDIFFVSHEDGCIVNDDGEIGVNITGSVDEKFYQVIK